MDTINFAELDDATLATKLQELIDSFNAIKALETRTPEQVTEALSLREQIESGQAERSTRKEAAAKAAADAALIDGTEFSLEEEDVDEAGAEDETDEDVEAEADEQPEAEAEVAAASKVTPAAVARKVAARSSRPAPPQSQDTGMVTLIAAADTGFAAGSSLSLADMGQAAINKLDGLTAPVGAREGVDPGPRSAENLIKFPIGKVRIPFPEELQITSKMSDPAIDSVMRYAADEKRLEGNSLVAAAGWCAPSETIYDLCQVEKVDGILSLPEVQVNRGGFKHSAGTDFSTVYAGVGFEQTEAQAIAGTTKTCYEVPCPTFTDERLDVKGLCIMVPILLEKGYPEQVANIMAKAMIAHEYKMNAYKIGKVVTAAGAARNFTLDLGSTVIDTLSGLDLVLADLRQKYRLGVDASIEVVLPVFAKSVFRNDLGARNGRPTDAVTDAEIAAHFSVRNANVQYVWGWQELTTGAGLLAWPATMNFVAYPAGTFVAGRADVINLSAVYDKASLEVNLYTGLFSEEGTLVAKMCNEAIQGVIPVCNAGRTGSANLVCA